MLSLNLARIRTPHERFDQVYEPRALAGESDAYGVEAPVVLGFDVYKDQDRFRLAGRVVTTLSLPCSRCLESFSWPVDAAFDLRYQPRSAFPAGSDRAVDEDDFSTAVYDNEAIDLEQLMREQFYLSMPMKPLCGEGCLGLCPDCGTNLNLGSCGCVREPDDPRFAALRALQDAGHEGGGRSPRKL